MSNLTQQGISALKRGDKNRARSLLLEAVRSNPRDVQAWLWLSGAVYTDEERAYCLQQVLRLDPDNAPAAKGLARLVAKGVVSLHPAVEPGGGAAAEDVSLHTSGRGEAKAPPEEDEDEGAGEEELIFSTSPSLLPVIIVLFLGLTLGGAVLFLTALLKDSGAAFVFFLTGALIVLGTIGTVIVEAWRRVFTHYTLTTERLIVQQGFIARFRKVIPVSRIQDVGYHQSVFRRILGIGDVLVESAGERGIVRLIDLPNCHRYSEMVLELVRNYGVAKKA